MSSFLLPAAYQLLAVHLRCSEYKLPISPFCSVPPCLFSPVLRHEKWRGESCEELHCFLFSLMLNCHDVLCHHLCCCPSISFLDCLEVSWLISPCSLLFQLAFHCLCTTKPYFPCHSKVGDFPSFPSYYKIRQDSPEPDIRIPLALSPPPFFHLFQQTDLVRSVSFYLCSRSHSDFMQRIDRAALTLIGLWAHGKRAQEWAWTGKLWLHRNPSWDCLD